MASVWLFISSVYILNQFSGKKRGEGALFGFKPPQIQKNQEKPSLRFLCHGGILSVVAVVIKIKAGVSFSTDLF